MEKSQGLLKNLITITLNKNIYLLVFDINY